MLLSKIKGILPWPFSLAEKQGPKTINQLPEELILQIFKYLSTEELLFTVSNVCWRWKQLSAEPKLWRTKSIFYDEKRPHVVCKCLKYVSALKHLHLGRHENLHQNVLKILSSHFQLKFLKRLDFLSSCRMQPEYVILILQRVGPTLESLTICLNDEIVSFGHDKKTCYAINNSLSRPGILFGVVGNLRNLKCLTLRGGYSTTWYHNELDTHSGCSKLEILDVRDFVEIVHLKQSPHKGLFVETLIRKNINSLRVLRVTNLSKREMDAILKCKNNLVELEMSASQMIGVLDQLTNLSVLHINGRFTKSKSSLQKISDYISTSKIMSNLKNLRLVQFNDHQNILLTSISLTCRELKVFRSEKCFLHTEGLTSLIRNLSLIEEIHLPHTSAISEELLSLLPIYLPKLSFLDLTGNGFTDCMEDIKRLKEKSNNKLFIRGTYCDSFPQCNNCTARDRSNIDLDDWQLEWESDESD